MLYFSEAGVSTDSVDTRIQGCGPSAADLETDPATVLGTQLDEHGGHQALLATTVAVTRYMPRADVSVGSAEDHRAIARLGPDQRPAHLMRPAHVLSTSRHDALCDCTYSGGLSV